MTLETLNTARQSNAASPPPRGPGFLSSLNDMRKRGLIDFYYHLWREYGDVVQFRLGPLKTFLFVRPEHIQHILVKNPDKYIKGLSHDRLRTAIGSGILTLEGEAWKQQRRLMQPTYTPRGIRQFANIMLEETLKLVEKWSDPRCVAIPVDINQEMAHVTISVISRSMFGVDISENFREVILALYSLLDYTAATTNAILTVPLFIPTPRNRRVKAAKQLVHDFVFDIIRQRRQEGLRDDLLSLLMSAKDEETGEVMDDEQLHDEVLITFFAGHETTATLLTWTWYLLAHYPAVEEKLHAELAAVLAGHTATLDDLHHLPYTRMVLDEVLRLYSPVTILARDAAVDDNVEGFPVPAGSLITMMPYVTHRHPEFWEKPLDFYPEHFTEDRLAARPRYAYYPFGAGQRICIGNHFAQMEATLMLAELAQRFRPRLAAENDGKVDFVGVIRPRKPILMTLEKRL